MFTYFDVFGIAIVEDGSILDYILEFYGRIQQNNRGERLLRVKLFLFSESELLINEYSNNKPVDLND